MQGRHIQSDLSRGEVTLWIQQRKDLKRLGFGKCPVVNMDEVFPKAWIESNRINVLQVIIKDKDFIIRIDMFKSGNVIFHVRVQKDAFELVMGEEDWKYFSQKIRRAHTKYMRNIRKKKKFENYGAKGDNIVG
jgi:hypothetical protein